VVLGKKNVLRKKMRRRERLKNGGGKCPAEKLAAIAEVGKELRNCRKKGKGIRLTKGGSERKVYGEKGKDKEAT